MPKFENTGDKTPDNDRQVGAVELKDGSTDRRAEVTEDGALKVTDSTGAAALGSLAPTDNFFAATKHDVNNEASPSTGGIFVGTGGNIAVVRTNDTVVNFLNVPDGAYLPVVAKRINATDTDAADIIFLVAAA